MRSRATELKRTIALPTSHKTAVLSKSHTGLRGRGFVGGRADSLFCGRTSDPVLHPNASNSRHFAVGQSGSAHSLAIVVASRWA